MLKDEEYNEKADVYSFGVVLWEICTRERPFKGLTQMQVVVAVGFNGERLPRVENPQVDPRLSELMQKCMADAWHERPDFADIVQQLEAIGSSYQRAAHSAAKAAKAAKAKQRAAESRTSKPEIESAGAPATDQSLNTATNAPSAVAPAATSGGTVPANRGRSSSAGSKIDALRNSFSRAREALPTTREDSHPVTPTASRERAASAGGKIEALRNSFSSRNSRIAPE